MLQSQLLCQTNLSSTHIPLCLFAGRAVVDMGLVLPVPGEVLTVAARTLLMRTTGDRLRLRLRLPPVASEIYPGQRRRRHHICKPLFVYQHALTPTKGTILSLLALALAIPTSNADHTSVVHSGIKPFGLVPFPHSLITRIDPHSL